MYVQEMDEDIHEILAKTPNLCGGGPLIAIVYCCGLEKTCPIRDTALRMLGISKEQYKKIKENHKIPAETCFHNLAYCCSPLKNCPVRNKALESRKISMNEYIKYKESILKDLIPPEKLGFALSHKVITPLIFVIIDVEGKTQYKGLGIGNMDLNLFWIMDVKEKKPITL